jgi:hypothetical protein
VPGSKAVEARLIEQLIAEAPKLSGPGVRGINRERRPKASIPFPGVRGKGMVSRTVGEAGD